MNHRVLLLSVLFALVANVCAQYFNFNARLTGDQMVPPVNTVRSAGLQIFFLPAYDPTIQTETPSGIRFTYILTTDINDITGLSIYAPAPSDTGPLLIDFVSSSKTGTAVLSVAGSATNPNVIFEYQKTLDSIFKIGFAYAILRTTAFPNGELRGKFSGAFSTGVQFFGLSLFPFPATDAVSPVVFLQCNTPFSTGVTTCGWNSAFPVGGAVDLQGPNGLLIPLIPLQQVGPGILPGVSGSGSVTVPAPFTVDQLVDFGNRGELRMAYRIGTIDLGSTALSISGKPATIEVNLNGTNVVPPVTTSATGTVELIMDQTRTLTLSHTVSNSTRFTLHRGAPGENGTESFNFLTGLVPIPSDVQLSLDPSVILSLFDFFSGSQQSYVSIASTANPQGEIRGQLAFHPNNEFSDTLNGQKMVPAVTSTLTGQAVLRYDSILDALYFNISSTSTSTTAVLLRGPASSTSTGPILATLCSFKCNLRRVFFGVLKANSGAFSSGQTLSSVLDVLLDGQAYIELQTTQKPSGELRANLVPSINNKPPFQISDTPFTRPDIDIFTPVPIPTPLPSIPRLFRRRIAH